MKVLWILNEFKYVTNKLVAQEVKKSQSILVGFILFYNICSDMTGEHDTRGSYQMQNNIKH